MLQVDYLVLADAAVTAEGKQYIHGAGWDKIYAASFPVTHPSMGVAIRLRVPWADTNQPHKLELDVLDADAKSIFPSPPGPVIGSVNVGRPVTVTPGKDQVLCLSLTLATLQFRRPQTYEVVVRIDEMEAGRSPFEVIPVPGVSPSG